MNDPIRLLDDPTALGPSAQRLLRSGRELSPPAGAKETGWSHLEAALGAGAGAATASEVVRSSTSGATSAGHASLPAAGKVAGSGLAFGTKLGIAGIVLGGALFGASALKQPSPVLSANPVSTEQVGFEAPAYTSFAALPVEHTAMAAKEPRREPAPTAGVSNKQVPAAAPAETTTPEDRKSQLKIEAAGVQSARSQLGSGNAAGAKQTLRELDRDVPRGVMGQERQVLLIEAMAKSGEGAAAGKLATAFIEAHPNSPYAERVRAYAR